MRHDHDEPVREARDVGSAARPRELHLRVRAVQADGGRVEIPVDVDLGAPDEARVHVAALQQTHQVDRARAPDRARDVRVVSHRVEELGRGLVANDSELEESDGIGCVRPLRDDERDEGQPHPDEDALPIADLARRLRDHNLAGADAHRRTSV